MRSASFRLLMISSTLATCGYALLLPVLPLWVAHGGAGALGAGVSTAVFMLATVLTQLAVPWLVGRLPQRMLLVASFVLLGLPAPLLGLSTALGPVLALSVLRGMGFGLFTVLTNALVAELVPVAEHGRATARYGVAIGIPQLVLLPAGVGLVEHLGFPPVFLVAAAPLLGVLPALFIQLHRPRPAAAADADGAADPPAADPCAPALPAASTATDLPAAAIPASPPTGAGPARWWLPEWCGPLVAMVSCAAAQGGLVTFLPLTDAGGLAVTIALLGTTSGSLVGRLVSGQLVDRRGHGGRMLRTGALLAALGMLGELVATGLAEHAQHAAGLGVALALVAGAVVVGFGFGLVQNDSLVSMFSSAGPARYRTASALWNVGYDTGTGLGAVGLGALAQPFGFPVAFGASALLLLLAALVKGKRGGRTTDPSRARRAV